MDLKLVDYGVDINEEQSLESIDLMKCGEFWYEGNRQTQMLEIAEPSKNFDDLDHDQWKEISKDVRRKCIATSIKA